MTTQGSPFKSLREENKPVWANNVTAEYLYAKLSPTESERVNLRSIHDSRQDVFYKVFRITCMSSEPGPLLDKTMAQTSINILN